MTNEEIIEKIEYIKNSNILTESQKAELLSSYMDMLKVSYS